MDEISLFLELPEKNEENENVEQISLFRQNYYEKLPELSEFKNRLTYLKSVNSRVLNSSQYLYQDTIPKEILNQKSRIQELLKNKKDINHVEYFIVDFAPAELERKLDWIRDGNKIASFERWWISEYIFKIYTSHTILK